MAIRNIEYRTFVITDPFIDRHTDRQTGRQLTADRQLKKDETVDKKKYNSA